MDTCQGPGFSAPFNVYVRFLSVPFDQRRVRVCDGMPMEAFAQLVREAFEPTYSDIPSRLLFYTKVRTAGGKRRTTLVEGVKGFLTPDCRVFVYPLDLHEDSTMPTHVDNDVEERYLG